MSETYGGFVGEESGVSLGVLFFVRVVDLRNSQVSG